MPSLTEPLLLRPQYVPKPWGGRKLADVLGRSDVPDGPVGESWDVADTDTVQSVVEGGTHDGKTLREVWGAPFPLLLKVIDAREDLSVQLHPDGEDGLPAKEEAWVALADGGRVALGEFGDRELPAPGAWLDAMDVVELLGPADQPPTTVHVPPGLVHAILADSLLFEVQNPVDVTWRLDDYGRAGLDGKPRALHLAPARKLLARRTARWRADVRVGDMLVGQRFAVRLLAPGQSACPAPGAAQAAFFVAGGSIHLDDGPAMDVPAGRTAVLPTCDCSVASPGWVIQAIAS